MFQTSAHALLLSSKQTVSPSPCQARSMLPSSQVLSRTNPELLEQSEGTRILLVDDDPFNIDLHRQILRSLGYTSIEVALDGKKLFEQFKKRPEGYFEVIITDISMPNLNGIEAAKFVRTFEREMRRKKTVKIGFITGHPNQKDQLICEQAPLNCWFYLSKPIKAPVLEGFLPAMKKPPGFLKPRDLDSLGPLRLIRSNNLPKKSQEPPQEQLPTILCIDDDIYTLDFLEELIGNLGAKVIKAKSGEEGLSLLKSAFLSESRENIPSLILTDCGMPKNGWLDSL